MIDSQDQLTTIKDVSVLNGYLRLYSRWDTKNPTCIYSGAAYAIIRKRVRYQRGERFMMFLCLNRGATR